jgi:hypothetical protein
MVFFTFEDKKQSYMYYLKNLYLQRLFVSKENVLEPVKANSLNFIHKGKLLNLKYLFVLCARSEFLPFLFSFSKPNLAAAAAAAFQLPSTRTIPS